MEQDVKTTAASRLQDSQRGLGKVVRGAELGRGQASVIVRLRALLSGAEHTSLFRVSSTDRATHGQYLSQRNGFQNAPRLPSFAGAGPCREDKCNSAAC